MNCGSVMFVDDEPTILTSLARLFRNDHDLQIFVALDALDALRKLELNQVDLVVTDFRMPGMNGAELLEEVSRRYPKIKGAILSAYPEVRAILRDRNGKQLRPFFYKPWNDESFRKAVRRLVRLAEEPPAKKFPSAATA